MDQRSQSLRFWGYGVVTRIANLAVACGMCCGSLVQAAAARADSPLRPTAIQTDAPAPYPLLSVPIDGGSRGLRGHVFTPAIREQLWRAKVAREGIAAGEHVPEPAAVASLIF
jgi:hypothetical protein